MAIENKIISKSIESAQKKVEGHNFDIRKHLVEYDDVANKQRMAIYEKRNTILSLADTDPDRLITTARTELLAETQQALEVLMNDPQQSAWSTQHILATMQTVSRPTPE